MKIEDILPPSLVQTGKRIIKYYKSQKFSISIGEQVNENILYRPTIIAQKKTEKHIIEVRERCDLTGSFEKFLAQCHSERIDYKIFYGVPEKINGEDTLISHTQRELLEKNCIGLKIVKESDIKDDLGTIQCNRKIVLEPRFKFGPYAKKIESIVKEYNKGNCLNALRDLSESVEECTMKIAKKAIKRGKIHIALADIEEKRLDWETVINILSTSDYKGVKQQKILDREISNSLKTFKNSRNLGDHWKTKAEKLKIEEKYPISMMQGFDVLNDLLKILNKV
jgi:hypothetical protein